MTGYLLEEPLDDLEEQFTESEEDEDSDGELFSLLTLIQF